MPVSVIRPTDPDLVTDNKFSRTSATSNANALSDDSDASFLTYLGSENDTAGDIWTSLPVPTGIPSGDRIKRVRTRLRARFAGSSVVSIRHHHAKIGIIPSTTGGSVDASRTVHIQGHVSTGIVEVDNGWLSPNEELLRDEVDDHAFLLEVSNARDYNNDLDVYEAWIDVEHFPLPTVVVNSPSGAEPTTSPVVDWTFDHPNFAQLQYEVRIFDDATYTDGSFDPNTSSPAWESGVVQSSASSLQVGEDLTNNVTYRAYVRVAADWKAPYDPLWSDWEYSQFNVDASPAAIPNIRVEQVDHKALISLEDNSTDPAAEEFRVEKKAETEDDWRTVRDAGAIQAGETLQALDVELRAKEYTEYRARSVRYTADGDPVVSEPTNVKGVYNDQHKWLLKDLLGSTPIFATQPSFSRASTAYLEGVEYPADVPRFVDSALLQYQHKTFSNVSSHSATIATKIAEDQIDPYGGANGVRWTGEGGNGLRVLMVHNMEAGQIFTAQMWVKNNDPDYELYLHSYVRTGNTTIIEGPYGESNAISAEDGWTWFRLTGEVTSDGTVFVHVTSTHPNGNTDATYAFGQVDLGSIASAWRPPGPDSILIEEGTTNLLPADQSQGQTWREGANTTVDSITEGQPDPFGGLNAVTYLASATAGSQALIRPTTVIDRVADDPFSMQIWVKNNDPNNDIEVIWARHSLDREVISSGEWQLAKAEGTATSSGGTFIQIQTADADIQLNVTIAFIQFEDKSYTTSWQIGGTARSADRLGLPTGILEYASQDSTLEFDINITEELINRSNVGGTYAPTIIRAWTQGTSRAIQIGMRSGMYWVLGRGNTTHSEFIGNLTPGIKRVAVVTEGLTISLYENGVLLGTTERDINREPLVEVTIGGDGSSYTQLINSPIIGTKISNRARTAEELADYTVPLEVDEDTTYFMDFEGSLQSRANTERGEQIELDIEQETLDEESTEAISRFQPLSSPNQRKTYPLVVKDSVHSERFDLTMGFLGHEDYEQFAYIRESQRVLFLTAPMRGGSWYAVFDSPRKKSTINMHDPVYRQVTIGVIEVDVPD